MGVLRGRKISGAVMSTPWLPRLCGTSGCRRTGAGRETDSLPDVLEVATLAEVDLGRAVGLTMSPSAVAEVVALDVRLDRLERRRTRYGWSLGSGHRVPVPGTEGGHAWGALGRVLSYRAAADDLLELSLDVWRHRSRPLEVQTTVVVGCFCAEDHEIHTVADREWPARDDAGLRDALVAAVETLEAWVALDLTPDEWRTRAGLPTRPGPPAYATPADQA